MVGRKYDYKHRQSIKLKCLKTTPLPLSTRTIKRSMSPSPQRIEMERKAYLPTGKLVPRTTGFCQDVFGQKLNSMEKGPWKPANPVSLRSGSSILTSINSPGERDATAAAHDATMGELSLSLATSNAADEWLHSALSCADAIISSVWRLLKDRYLADGGILANLRGCLYADHRFSQ